MFSRYVIVSAPVTNNATANRFMICFPTFFHVSNQTKWTKSEKLDVAEPLRAG